MNGDKEGIVKLRLTIGQGGGEASMSSKQLSEYRVKITPPLLTIVIFPDDATFGAKCLELDLITEDDTPEMALKSLIEMIREYVEDYQERWELFSESPNRAHHQPYVERLLRCKSDWEILEISAIKYGYLQL
jgi:hypothetical protein